MSLRFRPFRLANGLKTWLQADHAWPAFTAQAWVRVGAMDETDAQAGIAHVLEHMVFKGSRRYAPAELSRAIEAAGGSLNAETSREYTRYHIDIPSEGAELAIEALAELLWRARLDPAQWRHECPVILEEMKRRLDDPETMVWEHLQAAMHQEPFHSRSVIGTAESVSSITAADLSRFYREHYTAQRTLVVLSGNVTENRMRAWLKRAFGQMPSGTPAGSRQPSLPRVPLAQIRQTRPVQHSYAAWGWLVPGTDHPDQEALDLLATILGEGRGARLVRVLRDERKLVWTVSAGHYTQQAGGLFSLFFECESSRRRAVDRALAEQMEQVLKHPPSLSEMSRARNLLHTSWCQGLETFHHRAAAVGSYALDSQLPRLHAYLRRLNRLTAADLQRVARAYLSGPAARVVVEPGR